MNSNHDLITLISESRNLYDALNTIGSTDQYDISLKSFSRHRNIDDRSKLVTAIASAKDENDFLKNLLEMDADISRAIRPKTAMGQFSKKFRIDSSLKNYGNFIPIDKEYSDDNREAEINEIQIILNKRSKNNLIICAESGTGKTYLVEKYANTDLCTTRIFSIDLPKIISGTKYRGELESKIIDIFDKSIENNFTLFMDEIHMLGNTGSAEGGTNLLDTLKPYLTNPNFRMIGATTPTELSYITADSAFSRRFSVMRLKNLSKDQLYSIFVNFIESSDILDASSLSRFQKILDFLDNKIDNVNYPEKLIDFLEYYESYSKLFSGKSDVTIFNKYIDHRFE
ncbi:AAA family ATPase [Rothia sp. P4278]|uniref:AAA family ATPase n=1 Tax=Rothia sp. P4278 TaxID=3402658 RepID=UPI003ADABD44